MLRKIWKILSLLLVVAITQAQSYSSLKMEEIGNAINKKCLPKVDSIFDCPEIIKGKSLIVTYNQKQEITHLGISLFSNESKMLINAPVCNFIERLMLELILEKSGDGVKRILNRYKINIAKNGITYGTRTFTSLNQVLEEIRDPVDFSLHRTKEQFAAVWKFNQDNQLVVSFPATRDLIFGTDKKESDEMLNYALLEDNSLCPKKQTADNVQLTEKDLTYDVKKNIFMKKGNEFALKFINSNTYYRKTGDKFELLFSKDYPGESLCNLFLENNSNLNHTLHITHQQYGNFSPDIDISLQKFLCFFHDEYDIFTAASVANPKELKLTVILNNRNYNYVHLLIINTPVENIFKDDGVLNANFYSNIPQQNLKNLIGEGK